MKIWEINHPLYQIFIIAINPVYNDNMDEIEKQPMAYFQHDMRFQRQYNPGQTTNVVLPKSTLVVVMLLLFLCLLVSFLSLSAVVVLTDRVEALETRLSDVETRELDKQDKETTAGTAFVEEIFEKVGATSFTTSENANFLKCKCQIQLG